MLDWGTGGASNAYGTGEVSHVKSARQYSVRPATVPLGAGVYGCGGTDAGTGNWWDDGDFYINSRGNAAFAAGFGSWEALPRGGW